MTFQFWNMNDYFATEAAFAELSKKRRILVVDDDDMITREVKRVLESDGFVVQSAQDGLEAKVFLCQEQYDLILSDISMPVSDGIDLFRFVQETDQTPFILMSGYSDLRGQVERDELKFDGLLSKPFGRKDLRKIVDTLIG